MNTKCPHCNGDINTRSLEEATYALHDKIAEKLCCAPGEDPSKYVDDWVPACNGTEKEFLYCQKKYLYMWNRVTHKHSYYCVTDDVFVGNIDFHAHNGEIL